MTLGTLKIAINAPMFFGYQLKRLFPDEATEQINIQLSRWVRTGKLVRLMRNVFLFPDAAIDEFVVANALRTPSYVSLESALSTQGVIPDVAIHVTSVTPRAPTTIRTAQGVFLYRRLKPELFFGFTKNQDPKSALYYDIAEPEKALLDLIYIRRLRTLSSERVNRDVLDQGVLRRYGKSFPRWVQEVVA